MLVRALSDKTGLTARLSKALATGRLLVHDRGRVLADLACAIADGGEVISDFRVIGDQQELFGLVASVPTVWRTLDEIACGGEPARGQVPSGVNSRPRLALGAAAVQPRVVPLVRNAWRAPPAVDAVRPDVPLG